MNKKLLDILACPKCRGDINYDRKRNKIICDKCRLKFSVLKSGVPDMIIANAKKY